MSEPEAIDHRSQHLAWIEVALRRQHPDLPQLRLSAQSHYGPADHVAFVEVHGVADDPARRRKIRSDAADLLRRLGYRVRLDPGRDIYDVKPARPSSAHEELRLLQCLREACGSRGKCG
jgi:hypothetical protein